MLNQFSLFSIFIWLFNIPYYTFLVYVCECDMYMHA